VTVLTDSNYHSFVQADLALVEFYGQPREPLSHTEAGGRARCGHARCLSIGP
jgi:hypothetical protein